MSEQPKRKLTKEYFPHSYGASSTAKMTYLRKALGLEGIGLYWILIEELYNHDNGTIYFDELPAIAYNQRIDSEEDMHKLERVIKEFGLFVFNEEENAFTATEVQDQLQFRQEKSELARQSVQARWEKQKGENSNAPNSFSPYGNWQNDEDDKPF